jgi:hypothetical protein
VRPPQVKGQDETGGKRACRGKSNSCSTHIDLLNESRAGSTGVAEHPELGAATATVKLTLRARFCGFSLLCAGRSNLRQ